MTSHPSNQQRLGDRTDVVAGEMLAGKFRVERIVGRGGMGVVIEATNVQLDQRVALKLLAAGADDPAIVERFSREARAAARLRSEHVARVYDVGKDPVHGPFIVMELLEGKTLAEVLTATGRVRIDRAVEYVIDACEGLAEAHTQGIVHQDVKPGNLFLVAGSDGRPTIKLLDFGIATMRTKERVTEAKSSHSTSGTPAYLSPEQLRGATVDHRADQWALGCVLYELIVADRAFRATRFTELVTKILETEPHPFPDDLEIPAPVAAAIMRCLEKDPSRRYSSTGELALALLPFARRRAHSAVARAVAHLKTSGMDSRLEMPSSMPPRPSEDSIDLAPPEASAGIPRAAAVPAFSDEPGAQVHLDSAATMAVGRARGGRLWLVVVALFLVLVAVVGVIVWLRFGAPRDVAPPALAGATATTTAPVASSSSPISSMSVDAPPTSAAASAAAPSASVPQAPPTVSVAATAPPPPPLTGRPTVRPKTPPTSAVPSSDSEIRRSR